jgi:hypothetical protein
MVMKDRTEFNHATDTDGGKIDLCILKGINDVDRIIQSTSLLRGRVLVHLQHLKRKHGVDFTLNKKTKGQGIGEFVIAKLKAGWDGSNEELAALCRKIYGSDTKAQNISFYKNRLKNSPEKRKKIINYNKGEKTNKSRKGALIKGMTKKLPSEILANSVFKSKLDEIMKGYSGIYALYDDARLYYVGLTNNLRGRINQHLKDRHARKWTEFVIFRIKHVKYLKDIETLLLNIHNTPGNRHKGKVPLDADINHLLLDILKQHEKQMKSIKKALK